MRVPKRANRGPIVAKIDSLCERLDLEQLDTDLFRGFSRDDGRPRIFGGLVAAQSLVAACRTVEGRAAHSFHGHFLREGDTSVPVIYDVDCIRDGRSFATRRVVAKQHGKAIFNASISFGVEEEGLEHQAPMPDVAPPMSVPSSRERLREYAKSGRPVFQFLLNIEEPIEFRDLDPVDLLNPGVHKGVHHTWFRATGDLGDDPVLHQAVLAYASDYGLIGTAIHHHGHSFLSTELILASLDHAIWFHKPFRFDEWTLYVKESTRASGGRGLTLGRIYSQEGELIASVAQEGLMRIRKPR